MTIHFLPEEQPARPVSFAMSCADDRLLLDCYRSGQIPETAWQEHLRDNPRLRHLLLECNAQVS